MSRHDAPTHADLSAPERALIVAIRVAKTWAELRRAGADIDRASFMTAAGREDAWKEYNVKALSWRAAVYREDTLAYRARRRSAV